MQRNAILHINENNRLFYLISKRDLTQVKLNQLKFNGRISLIQCLTYLKGTPLCSRLISKVTCCDRSPQELNKRANGKNKNNAERIEQ
jgi:hypothetical protein